MKSITTIFLALIFAFNALKSQDVLWHKTFQPDTEAGSFAYNITSTDDQGIVLIGSLNSKPTHYPYTFLLKLDNNGSQEWLKYIYTDNYYLMNLDCYLKQNKDRSYTFLSSKMTGPEADYMFFFKYELSPDGDSLKMVMRSQQDTGHIKGSPLFLKLDDGTIIYSLHQQILNYFEGIYFVKTDSAGRNIWKKKLKDDSLELKPITRPVPNWNGGFIFISAYIKSEKSTDIVVVKTDQECNEIERKSLKTDFDNDKNYIYTTKDSGYVVMSRVHAGLTKLDKDLNIIWQKSFPCDSLALFNSIVENDNGDFICAGTSSIRKKIGPIDTSTTKGRLVKVTKDGEKAWEFKFGTDGVENDIRYIARAGNNEYFVAGTVQSGAIVYKIRDNMTGVEENDKEEELICPNPVHEKLYINREYGSSRTLRIYSSEGRKVLELDYKDEIDVSGLAAGIYFLEINNRMQRFVKE